MDARRASAGGIAAVLASFQCVSNAMEVPDTAGRLCMAGGTLQPTYFILQISTHQSSRGTAMASHRGRSHLSTVGRATWSARCIFRYGRSDFIMIRTSFTIDIILIFTPCRHHARGLRTRIMTHPLPSKLDRRDRRRIDIALHDTGGVVTDSAREEATVSGALSAKG